MIPGSPVLSARPLRVPESSLMAHEPPPS